MYYYYYYYHYYYYYSWGSTNPSIYNHQEKAFLSPRKPTTIKGRTPASARNEYPLHREEEKRRMGGSIN